MGSDNNSNTNEGAGDGPAPLRRAPPPWHAQLLVGSLFLCFAWQMPAAVRSVDEIATVDTFSRRLFPSVVSPEGLVFCRMSFAVVLLCANLRQFLFAQQDFQTMYPPGSRLKPAVLRVRGLLARDRTSWRQTVRTNTSFSNLSNAMLGISFFLNALIPFLDAYHRDRMAIPKNLLRLAVLAWTMAAPASLLVSLVVTYVLWPQDVARGKDTAMYKEFWVLQVHTFNSLASLTEVGLLGGLPCRFQEFPAAPLYGSIYVLFAWIASNGFYQDDFRRDGPQFLYPFFDTTLGWKCSFAILGLFAVLVLIYGLFNLAEFILAGVGGGIVGRVAAVLLLTAAVCRFRD